VPVLNKALCDDALIEFDDLRSKGSRLGTASVTMLDDSVDWWLPFVASTLYKPESCGQCTPCREGTSWLEALLIYMERDDADRQDIPMLEEISRTHHLSCERYGGVAHSGTHSSLYEEILKILITRPALIMRRRRGAEILLTMPSAPRHMVPERHTPRHNLVGEWQLFS
jgi:hypothetical protein